jgi:hypothetical protein
MIFVIYCLGWMLCYYTVMDDHSGWPDSYPYPPDAWTTKLGIVFVSFSWPLLVLFRFGISLRDLWKSLRIKFRYKS